jgi:pro-apoptotic serine protease NMA111
MPVMWTFLFLVVGVVANAGDWESTLEKVVPSVVMIRTYAPRSFDGQGAGSSFATGFVVDAENGIILTNRHVVRTGPIVAEAILQNNEEIDLTPIYRDPVHDFGFLKYDPGDVRFHHLRALPLKPSHARQGTDIRLIGSDAGEKVSILSGILARLDRHAPDYGADRYNDFNTFYLQAASGSSGGSSGSPVVDIHGHVIALNAGSNRKAASSFFLPLDRVEHALRRVQQGEEVRRGTMHVTFIHRTFDEAARYGLSPNTEAGIRREDPDATGVLVVERVLVGGAADGHLVSGDVLTRVNGERISEFVPLEALLDAHVGESLDVEIERGKEPVQLSVHVAELADVTPHEFVEIGNSVFNIYSYQLARHHLVPAKGIYVSQLGYMLNRRVSVGSVITHVNGQSVEDLDSFVQAMEKISDREAFTLRYFHPSEPRRSRMRAIMMDRKWFPAQRCSRNDASRWWDCTSLQPAPTKITEPISAAPQEVASKRAQRLANGMVGVRFDIPYRTDGVYGNTFNGMGIVVDADKGLVLVDRDTVTAALGDVTLTFAGSVETQAEVVALHPVHNMALVRYDPSTIGDTSVTAIQFTGSTLGVGDKAYHVGKTNRGKIESEATSISDVRGVSLPIPVVPFYRQINLEMIHTKTGGSSFYGGVLTDKKGRPSALWASFPVHDRDDSTGGWWLGIPARVVNAFLADPSGAHTLGVEWRVTSLIDARKRGLEPSIAAEIEAHDPSNRLVMEASRIAPDGPAQGVLIEGDILIRLDGELVTRLTEIDERMQPVDLRLTFMRDGEIRTETIKPKFVDSMATDRLLMWGGALFQAPHPALGQQRGQPMDGAYVSYWWSGSPAGRYRLRPMRRIVEVDGAQVVDLNDFAAAVRDKKSGESTRLLTVDVQGRKRMVTLEADNYYWPLVEITRTEDGWVRRPLPATGAQ